MGKIDSESSYASFSKCGKYRWVLHRKINDSKKEIVFFGLNPSIADGKKNDATLRRINTYINSWGYGNLTLINLFAIISTDSKMIKCTLDPIGLLNDHVINNTLKSWSKNKNCDLWLGWGAKGKFMKRNTNIIKRINKFILIRNKNFHIESNALIIGLTKEGDPKHPLYMRKNLTLKPYKIIL